MTRPARILIVGGGYVAVWAHRAIHRGLRRRIDRGEVVVTIVAPGLVHRFHGFTGEVLGGVLPPQRLVTPLARLCPGAELVDGTVSLVDLDGRRVTVTRADGLPTVLSFDQLILAAGSVDSGCPPGITEYGYSTKDPASFEALRGRLARPWHNLVVVGGGLAGVELCAAIAEKCADPWRRIHLVHGGASLVAELGPRYRRLAGYLATQLDGYGVRVRTGTTVVGVGPDGVDLDDGTALPADVVINTAGQRPVFLPGTERLDREPDGRLRVDGYLRVVGYRWLWAGGDLAAVPHAWSNRPTPANALWAIKHGSRLGRNVVGELAGRRPGRFRYPGLGRAASAGLGKGAGHLFGVVFTGWFAWLTRVVFFLNYMPSRRQARAALGELYTDLRRHGRSHPAGPSGGPAGDRPPAGPSGEQSAAEDGPLPDDIRRYATAAAQRGA